MSMKWSEVGYGYQLFNSDNMSNIKKFIIDNGNYSEDEMNAINEAENEFDLQEVIDDSVSGVIASYINIREGLVCAFNGYASCGFTDQEQMIGISPRYSWLMKPEDMLTKKKADNLLEKYAKILGITEKADYFIARYYG